MDEAQRWFVRMLEESNRKGKEKEAFDRWRAASPENDAAYQEVERLWRKTEQLIADPAIQDAAAKAMSDSNGDVRVSHWHGWLGAMTAAVIMLLGVVTFRASKPLSPIRGEHYETSIGEQRTVRLADGSRMVLDTDTALVERYSSSERRIDLLRGRTQFLDVTDPSGRPFVVYAGGGKITAIGTEFQVQVDTATTNVVLLVGAVAVAAEQSKSATDVTLRPDESLNFNRKGEVGEVRKIDSQATTAWTNGQLIVHGWRLADLLAELNRYSKLRVELEDESLGDMPISGVFRTGDQQALLLVLQRGWSLQGKRVSDHLIVLHR